MRARGLDPTDLRANGDVVLVEGDILFSRKELLASASTLVEKGYVAGEGPREPISSGNGSLIKIDWRDEDAFVASIAGCDASCFQAVGIRVHQTAKQWADAEARLDGSTQRNRIGFCSDNPINLVSAQLPSCRNGQNRDVSSATVRILAYLDLNGDPPYAVGRLPSGQRPGSSLGINWMRFPLLIARAQTETLLHEWGHVLGLHHPIDACKDDHCEGAAEGRSRIYGTAQTHELYCFSIPDLTFRRTCMWRNRSTGQLIAIADNTNFGYDTVMVATLPFDDCRTGTPAGNCPARDTLSPDDKLSIVTLYPTL
ncbi:MAG: hypothetical protein OXR73_07600 [Myxococcales bacterium]|nr:hypothetical protein [Myxococcales bacterium]